MNNTLVIAEMEENYQSEKKEKENLELKQENLEKENQAFKKNVIKFSLIFLISV